MLLFSEILSLNERLVESISTFTNMANYLDKTENKGKTYIVIKGLDLDTAYNAGSEKWEHDDCVCRYDLLTAEDIVDNLDVDASVMEAATYYRARRNMYNAVLKGSTTGLNASQGSGVLIETVHRNF